jgi:hypothetical protein
MKLVRAIVEIPFMTPPSIPGASSWLFASKDAPGRPVCLRIGAWILVTSIDLGRQLM